MVSNSLLQVAIKNEFDMICLLLCFVNLPCVDIFVGQTQRLHQRNHASRPRSMFRCAAASACQVRSHRAMRGVEAVRQRKSTDGWVSICFNDCHAQIMSFVCLKRKQLAHDHIKHHIKHHIKQMKHIHARLIMTFLQDPIDLLRAV